jgi:hypothetical protein
MSEAKLQTVPRMNFLSFLRGAVFLNNRDKQRFRQNKTDSLPFGESPLFEVDHDNLQS